MVRTALFNWAYARHTGGTFVFRIEDTDSARDSEESYEDLLGALRWLGLDWDEGPRSAGRTSRTARAAGSTSTPTSPAACSRRGSPTSPSPPRTRSRSGAARPGRTPSSATTTHDRHLTDEQKAAFRAEGRQPVLRLRMPDRDWAWDDLVRGRSVRRDHVPDFVIVRGNGEPLYTLVNPVDDALMGITHVLRGEDLLSSTPRQIAMYAALAQIGVGDGSTPRSGTCPTSWARATASCPSATRRARSTCTATEGYLPEGLLNYLALLGWSPGDDLEFFSPREMAALFDIERVQPNPARFDSKKCLAINGDWIRHITADDLADRLLPYLRSAGAINGAPNDEQRSVIAAAVPLVQERMATLREGAESLSFLLVEEAAFAVDEQDAAKVLTADAEPALRAARDALDRAGLLRPRLDRGGAAGCARRRPRAQAEGRLRPGARRGDRSAHLPAAVRVPRAARPGPHLGPHRRRPLIDGAPGGGCDGGRHQGGPARFGTDRGERL
jgi:glutamyl-tRNA synthetase